MPFGEGPGRATPLPEKDAVQASRLFYTWVGLTEGRKAELLQRIENDRESQIAGMKKNEPGVAEATAGPRSFGGRKPVTVTAVTPCARHLRGPHPAPGEPGGAHGGLARGDPGRAEPHAGLARGDPEARRATCWARKT